MILKNKTAIVFAANGMISRHVAKALACEGARIFLAGRNEGAIQALVEEMAIEGHYVKGQCVDLLSETELDRYISDVIAEDGKIDVVFNGIGLRPNENEYGMSATSLSFDGFLEPIRVIVGSQFLTSRLAIKYMIATESPGTILTLSASLSRLKIPFMAGITTACTAIEGLTRSLAGEFGQYGIRIICLTPTGFPDTRTIQETVALQAKTMGINPEEMNHPNNSLMKRGPSLEEFGTFAAFAASDMGSVLNSHIIDVDCGMSNVI